MLHKPHFFLSKSYKYIHTFTAIKNSQSKNFRTVCKKLGMRLATILDLYQFLFTCLLDHRRNFIFFYHESCTEWVFCLVIFSPPVARLPIVHREVNLKSIRTKLHLHRHSRKRVNKNLVITKCRKPIIMQLIFSLNLLSKAQHFLHVYARQLRCKKKKMQSPQKRRYFTLAISTNKKL